MLKAWEVTYLIRTGEDRTLTCLTDEEDTFPTAQDFAKMIEIRTGRKVLAVRSWVQVPH